MKKLLINALILSDKNTGLGVYTLNVLKHIIPKLNDEHTLSYKIICSDKRYLLDLDIDEEKIIEIKIKNFIDRNYKIKKFLKSADEKFDLLYSTTQHGIIYKNINQIVTVHDLMPLFYPSGRYHQWFYYKFILPIILKYSKNIITDSNNTKIDILKYYKINDENIKVIYAGYDRVEHSEINISDEFYNRYPFCKDGYLLIVGIHYYYKNIHSVIEAIKCDKRLANEKLAIIGNYENKYGEYLKKMVNKLDIKDRVFFTGYVSDSDKTILYKNAKSFVYPTLYEGFGLPVLEAMSYGVPTIISNTSSLPEVADNASIFFNPNDVNDISEKICSLINSPEIQEDIVKKGYKNIERFDWSITADKIYNVIMNSLF